MDIKDRIEQARAKLKAAEQAKTVAETQLKVATEQCNEVMAEMEQYGVTPDTIQAEIAKLTQDVDTELAAIEAAIPQV